MVIDKYMVNDPIADMLIRIKNGYLAGKRTINVPHSKVKEALARVLEKYEYIGSVTKAEVGPDLRVTLLYQEDGRPALSEVQRISKPGLRRYAGVTDLAKIRQGLGFVIVSTPKGLMTHTEAKKQRLGGEVICKIW